LKIRLSNPDNLYASTLYTEGCDVEITEAFIGPMLTTVDGEKIGISMRDSGFEVCYTSHDGAEPQWFSFQGGAVKPNPKNYGNDDAMMAAWLLIANAWGGNWDAAPNEWSDAATRWRDEHLNSYLAATKEQRPMEDEIK